MNDSVIDRVKSLIEAGHYDVNSEIRARELLLTIERCHRRYGEISAARRELKRESNELNRAMEAAYEELRAGVPHIPGPRIG